MILTCIYIGLSEHISLEHVISILLLYDLYTIEEFAHLVIIIILLDTFRTREQFKYTRQSEKEKKVHSRNFEKELISILRQWKQPEVC